ncbi:hypothetical protein CALVIDRAFT_54632 [Calocera viscosa TUFC12733]|uniref:BZIP domain-containing protein n=1 Tax=Calocera viscosa (strain TUFC12733) TaxID=1330018 RepID=A0A167NVA8_CALVF|nr:hypothetical protein CALVIDRAFT_54632 [Calocera viscosa TUFC12733]
MDAIAPSLLLRQSSVESSTDSTRGDDYNSRKRRRPNDPPHEAPPTPGPEATPEERRAARAQRNRIAAQSSRDRRKEEHRYLRDRITELERENQLLRAGHFMSPTMTSPAPSSVSLDSAPASGSADQWKRDIESENRDLRTKVANLERMFALIVPAAMNPLASAPDASSSTVSVSATPVAADTLQNVPTRHLARVATDSLAESAPQRVGTNPLSPTFLYRRTPSPSTGQAPTGSSPSFNSDIPLHPLSPSPPPPQSFLQFRRRLSRRASSRPSRRCPSHLRSNKDRILRIRLRIAPSPRPSARPHPR